MRIALLSDIHSNLEALEACLAHASRLGVDQYVFLGDFVGYGADPQAVVDRIAPMVADGALAILGNHDEAVWIRDPRMNDWALAAANWTCTQIDTAAVTFLKALPLVCVDDGRQYVHGDASLPAAWRYVMDEHDAARSLEAAGERLVFAGHVHVPRVFSLRSDGHATMFAPVTGQPIPLKGPRRWQIVLGAVGQPRDGQPAAAWSLYDSQTQEITYHRVAYDIETTARKIRAAGLPEGLAARLFVGR